MHVTAAEIHPPSAPKLLPPTYLLQCSIWGVGGLQPFALVTSKCTAAEYLWQSWSGTPDDGPGLLPLLATSQIRPLQCQLHWYDLNQGLPALQFNPLIGWPQVWSSANWQQHQVDNTCIMGLRICTQSVCIKGKRECDREHVHSSM